MMFSLKGAVGFSIFLASTSHKSHRGHKIELANWKFWLLNVEVCKKFPGSFVRLFLTN